MKILANDGLDSSGLEIFEEQGFEVDTDKKDPTTLVDVVGEYDGLVVRSATKVIQPIIEAGAKGKLKIIGRAGVGYDNVDVATASEHGIVVKIAPNGNTESTAELALGLMLAVSRNIPQAHASLREGVWIKKPYKGHTLTGKKLGIIGCGRIGKSNYP
jgi:D-3-phosphoglycerate dehydrogenase